MRHSFLYLATYNFAPAKADALAAQHRGAAKVLLRYMRKVIHVDALGRDIVLADTSRGVVAGVV